MSAPARCRSGAWRLPASGEERVDRRPVLQSPPFRTAQASFGPHGCGWRIVRSRGVGNDAGGAMGQERGSTRGSGRLALAEDRIAALLWVGLVVAGHVPCTVAAVRGRLTAWRCCPASIWELTRARLDACSTAGRWRPAVCCAWADRDTARHAGCCGSPWRTRVISAWVMLGCVWRGPVEARSAVRVAARSGLGRAVAPIRPRPRGRFHGSFGQRRGRGR